MSPRNHKLQKFLWFALGLAWLGCSSSTGGLSVIEPIPDGGRYSGTKNDNVVNVRLSSDGVNYINSQWRTLIEALAPGQVFKLPFSCTPSNFPVLGDVILADQGTVGCTQESCGRLDGKCDAKDSPQEIEATIVDFVLTPESPDQVSAAVTLQINTGKIMFDTVDRTHGSCLWLGALKCSVEFNSSRTAPSNNAIAAVFKFSINSKWDNLLGFELASIDGASICGASGAAPPPNCLEPDDINIDREGNLCGLTSCSTIDLGPLKNFVLRQISPILQTQIRSAIGNFTCMPCGNGLAACPSSSGATSTCKEEKCIDDATNECVPRALGLEGRVKPGNLLAGFGAPSNSQFDMSIGLGSSFSVDQGISLGTRGGLSAGRTHECVPTQSAPAYVAVPAPNFDAEAPASGYHVGIGLSQPFLDQALYETQQSGALCLGISSSKVSAENFKLLLPSLGKLTTRDGKDAPMMIALRPGKAPTVKVGAGTVDPATKKPIDPLLTLTIKDLAIDFYAMIDERQARLFSLTVDISVPFSLVLSGCNSIQPALGDLDQLVTNVRTSSSELLVEDPKVFEGLVPAVIGLAEPALANVLVPFQLPELSGFKFRLTATKGLGKSPTSNTFSHLGVYAQLLPSNFACAVAGPSLKASLLRLQLPSGDELKQIGSALPKARAWLQLASSASNRAQEFAFRVDGGLWSTYRRAQGEVLEVTHPLLLLQGMHQIEVRARYVDEPGTESLAPAVNVRVDVSPPEVRLKIDRAGHRIDIEARDSVTASEGLQYAYQLGNEPQTAWQSKRSIDLEAAESAGGLNVFVKDEAGNIGVGRYKVPTVVEREIPSSSREQASGCVAVSPSPWVWLTGAVWLWSRTRRRMFN